MSNAETVGIDKKHTVHGRRYTYTIVSVGVIAIVFAGFARSYYLNRLFEGEGLSSLLHLHGAVMTLWFLLFFVQALLIAARKIRWHRYLGMFGVAVAVTVVGVGAVVAVTSAHAGMSADALSFLVVPLGDLCVFAVLFGLAICFRRKGATHKRLILLASISLLPAAFARIPVAFMRSSGEWFFFWNTDIVVLLCVTYDTVMSRRIHPAFLWGGVFVVISQPLRLMLSHTALWLHVASWLTHFG